MKKKFICTIEARMGSKRFPGKSLIKLNKKDRLIDYVVKNVQKSKYFNNKNIYILTSDSKNNNSLVRYIKNNYNVNIICGSEKNVFSRYLVFKKKNKIPILRLTADNPFIDPILINKFVEVFSETKIDYLTTRAMEHSKNWKIKSSFPKGISLEAFLSNKLFAKEKEFNKNIYEFPTWFFFNKHNNNKFKIRKFKSFDIYKKSKLNESYTIDTKKDYLRLMSIIKKNNFKPGFNNFYNLIQTKNF
jgi:spore coat polysaccharide biosynthesis protein SpsF